MPKLQPKQLGAPGGRAGWDNTLKGSFHVLIQVFCLAIGLKLETRRYTYLCPQSCTEHLASELMAPIKDIVTGYTMKLEYMFN